MALKISNDNIREVSEEITELITYEFPYPVTDEIALAVTDRWLMCIIENLLQYPRRFADDQFSESLTEACLVVRKRLHREGEAPTCECGSLPVDSINGTVFCQKCLDNDAGIPF